MRLQLVAQLRKELMGRLIGNVEYNAAAGAAELDLDLISSCRPRTVSGDINLENRHGYDLPN